MMAGVYYKVGVSTKITKFKFTVIYFNQDRRKPVKKKFKKGENKMTNREMFSEYPDIVTAEQLQKMLHIGRNTAYAMLKDKTIVGKKAGRGYIIPKINVIKFVESIA